jgi:DNA repair exonuclease SbcCD ATPase subunit
MEFDFSKHNGLNYIYGTNLDINGTTNGVGKSTIFVDAILFALYGKTLKNTNNAYIANRVLLGKKIETNVTLNFTVAGRNYEGISTIRPGGSTVKFRLFEDGIEITKSTISKTREFLKKEILKCSFGLFVNSVILSASNSYNFFGMKKSEKREYIENIFKITCFGEMLKAIRADMNSLSRHILLEQQQQRQLKENLEQYKNKFDSFKKDKLEKIKTLKEKIKLKKITIDETDVNLIDTTVVKAELQDYKDIKESIKLAINKISKKIGEGTISIEHIKETIEKNEDIISLVCDDCKKKLDSGYTQELKNKIKEISDLNVELLDKKDQLNDALETISNDIKDCKKRLEKIENDNKINENNILIVKHLEDDIAQFETNIDEIKQGKNPFKTMIQEASDNLKSVTEILDNHYSDKTDLEVLEHVVSDDGAKKFMIKDLVKVLNTLIRHYLEEMGAQFTLHFDDTFDCVFLTNTGECDYSSFSAGERQRINIATLFAFRDILGNNGIDSNIFVLDEVIDQGIDEYALKAILGILRRSADEKDHTVYIISHRSETVENGLFDNIIEIEKKHSISKKKQDAQGEVDEN